MEEKKTDENYRKLKYKKISEITSEALEEMKRIKRPIIIVGGHLDDVNLIIRELKSLDNSLLIEHTREILNRNSDYLNNPYHIEMEEFYSYSENMGPRYIEKIDRGKKLEERKKWAEICGLEVDNLGFCQ